MKAKPISILQDIESDPDFVAGRKYNGFNEILVVKNGRVRLFNRSGTEQTENVPHITGVKVPESMDLILPCEGIAPSDRVEDAKSIFGSGAAHSIDWQAKNGRAQLKVVSIARYKGEDLSQVPFGERIDAQYEAVLSLIAEGVQELEVEFLCKAGKQALFEYVVRSGGEGVVIKKLSGLEKDWFKVKKMKTWDAVIIGFTNGKGKYRDVIGAIRYGFFDYDGNLKETGKCSGMTDAERAMFASAPQTYVGRVVEIRGQELGNRGGIIFPRFVRMRDDKLPTSCLLPSS